MQNNVAVISLTRIRKNAKQVVRVAKVPLYAVVKDDAYGHGAEAVAHSLAGIARAFAVSTIDEGASLRTAGISEEILVLTPPLCEREIVRSCAYDLTITVSSLPVLRLVAETCKKFETGVAVHFAVNTGMNRYGFLPHRTGYASRLAADMGLNVTGVFSHLYAPEDLSARESQREQFVAATEAVQSVFPQAVRHLSATGGILAGERYRFDAVRSGIALYGYLPRGFEGKLPVLPAMRLYTHVVESRTFSGGGVGYAVAKQEYQTLTTLRAGYGDGLFREGGEGAIGSLCMDAQIREGGGRMGARRLAVRDISAYAKEHGTTEYEVLCHLSGRAEKQYV